MQQKEDFYKQEIEHSKFVNTNVIYLCHSNIHGSVKKILSYLYIFKFY